MTKRLLQHRKPNDAPFSIKQYLQDEWQRIPLQQKGGTEMLCLDCGLPCMRFVYQESETYTAICMSCGHAHRYLARSLDNAKGIYFKAITDKNVINTCYRKALHATGLDHNDVSHRNYFTAEDNPFSCFLPTWYKETRPGVYQITPEGFRFLGYDLLDEEGHCKPILW